MQQVPLDLYGFLNVLPKIDIASQEWQVPAPGYWQGINLWTTNRGGIEHSICEHNGGPIHEYWQPNCSYDNQRIEHKWLSYNLAKLKDAIAAVMLVIWLCTWCHHHYDLVIRWHHWQQLLIMSTCTCMKLSQTESSQINYSSGRHLWKGPLWIGWHQIYILTDNDMMVEGGLQNGNALHSLLVYIIQ